MIFKFGRKKFSDVIKVVQFLDKEGIEYEVMADIEVAVAGGLPTGPAPAPSVDRAALDPESQPATRAGITPIKGDNDPAWKLANHDGKLCRDKGICRHGTHYGMIED